MSLPWPKTALLQQEQYYNKTYIEAGLLSAILVKINLNVANQNTFDVTPSLVHAGARMSRGDKYIVAGSGNKFSPASVHEP